MELKDAAKIVGISQVSTAVLNVDPFSPFPQSTPVCFPKIVGDIYRDLTMNNQVVLYPKSFNDYDHAIS